jgi:hypothetical protein
MWGRQRPYLPFVGGTPITTAPDDQDTVYKTYLITKPHYCISLTVQALELSAMKSI